MITNNALIPFLGTTLTSFHIGRVTFEDVHGGTIWTQQWPFCTGRPRPEEIRSRSFATDDIVRRILSGELQLRNPDDLHYVERYDLDEQSIALAHELLASINRNYQRRQIRQYIHLHTSLETASGMYLEMLRFVPTKLIDWNFNLEYHRLKTRYASEVKRNLIPRCWDCEFEGKYTSHKSGTHTSFYDYFNNACTCSDDTFGLCPACLAEMQY